MHFDFIRVIFFWVHFISCTRVRICTHRLCICWYVLKKKVPYSGLLGGKKKYSIPNAQTKHKYYSFADCILVKRFRRIDYCQTLLPHFYILRMNAHAKINCTVIKKVSRTHLNQDLVFRVDYFASAYLKITYRRHTSNSLCLPIYLILLSRPSNDAIILHIFSKYKNTFDSTT